MTLKNYLAAKRRKPKPAKDRAERFSVSVPKEQADWLRKVGGGSAGHQARKIIDHSFRGS